MNSSKNSNAAFVSLLIHPETDKVVRTVLAIHGYPICELDDGVCEIRVRALESFRRKAPPEELAAMKALCATMAERYAIDRLRKQEVRDRYDEGLCEEPDAYELPRPSGEQRDPVDAVRQLEVAASLFREGRMPEHGVDILEGIASGCTYKEVGEDLGITTWAVKGRLKTMRKRFSEAIAARRMG